MIGKIKSFFRPILNLFKKTGGQGSAAPASDKDDSKEPTKTGHTNKPAETLESTDSGSPAGNTGTVKDQPSKTDSGENKSDILMDWSVRAINIVATFEGVGVDWGNPVGNFDGAGLTCGALGWTIKWKNQHRLVRDFVNRYGQEKARSLMPKKWSEYWEGLQIPSESEAIAYFSKWSTVKRHVVKEPYKTELNSFWSSAEMIEIQKKYAAKDMGVFAMSQAEKSANYFGTEVRFWYFAYWFDHAVLNGTSKAPDHNEARNVTLQDVWDWMAFESGYNTNDFRKNRLMWMQMHLLPFQETLLKLAMIRADNSREDFDTTVMNRRGTIAVGQGWVNGTLRKLQHFLEQ